jgi:hypothetical protein
MAKIEMDISEYEAMKKVEKLLENSLQREQELSGAVELLQKEKIKIMEQNEKSVTIIEEKRITQVLYGKITEEDAMRAICSIANVITGKSPNYNNYSTAFLYDTLIEKLFKKSETQDCPPLEKKVVYKGLDEVIERITKEVKESLDNKVKEKLKRLKVLETTYRDLSETYSQMKGEIFILESARETFDKQNDKLCKKVEHLTKRLIQVDSIPNLLFNVEKEVLSMNLFNKNQKKSVISSVIAEWKTLEI